MAQTQTGHDGQNWHPGRSPYHSLIGSCGRQSAVGNEPCDRRAEPESDLLDSWHRRGSNSLAAGFGVVHDAMGEGQQ
jgi:hypothetical protein